MARRRFLTGLVTNFDDAFRFAPLEPECEVVQFDRPLSEPELRKAAAICATGPTLRLDWMRNVTSLWSFSGLLCLESVELGNDEGFD